MHWKVQFWPEPIFFSCQNFCLFSVFCTSEERLLSLLRLEPTAYIVRRSALDILETEVRAELDKDGAGTSPLNRSEHSSLGQRSSSIKAPHLVLSQMFLILVPLSLKL